MSLKSKTVQGPCAIILTTTSADVDEELINRFIRLTVNEDKEQTQAIHQAQRQSDTLEGLKENVIVGHRIPAGTGMRNYETIIVGS